MQDGWFVWLHYRLAEDEALLQDAAQHLILISNRMIEGALQSSCVALRMGQCS